MPGEIVGSAGPRRITCTRDAEGHREYKVTYRVKVQTDEGPAEVLRTPGLHVNGSPYIVGADIDLYAWCRPNANVSMVVEDGNPDGYYDIEQTFGTKPPEFTRQRCNDVEVQSPILEPPKVSGNFNKLTVEASFDRFGNPLNNSAHEPFRGPQVEFDSSRPTVRIEQNVPDLQLALMTQFVNRVNDGILWGCLPRCVKLSSVSWERLFYGFCYVYYKRTLEFDINFETWDRFLLDEGSKVLNGRWDESTGEYVLVDIGGATPSAANPNHFMQAVDRAGNPMRLVLNGAGLPAESVVGTGQQRLASVTTGTNLGSGYVVGDILTLSGGTFTTGATVRVTRVSGSSNALAEVAIINRGLYSAVPGNPVATTNSGSGSGANLNATWETAPGIATNIGYANVQYYKEANFLLLGVPPIF